MIEYIAASMKGCRNDDNEDRIMIDDTVLSDGVITGAKRDELIPVVCDGVSGTNEGGKAAELVACSFKSSKGVDKVSPLTISRHLHRINHYMTIVGSQNNDQSGMASTVAGIYIKEKQYIAFNAGDTRIYRIGKDNISLISRDHTRHEYEDDEFLHERGESITSYIGGNGNACFPSIKKGIINKNDVLLVCSDGIYKSIAESDIKSNIIRDISIEAIGRAIMNTSIQNGSLDDRSMILIRCA